MNLTKNHVNRKKTYENPCNTYYTSKSSHLLGVSNISFKD